MGNSFKKKGNMTLYQILLFVFGMLPNFKAERITGANVNTNNPSQFRLVEIFKLLTNPLEM